MQRPLFDDRPVIVGRAGHPLAGAGAAQLADLAAFPWIVPAEGTPLRRQWRQMFEAAGVEPPRVAIECGSVMMVRQLLIESDFLTLLSPDQVAVELEAGWLARIGAAPGDPSRTIGITTRADWRPTRAQRRFLAAVEHEAEQIAERRLLANANGGRAHSDWRRASAAAQSRGRWHERRADRLRRGRPDLRGCGRLAARSARAYDMMTDDPRRRAAKRGGLSPRRR